VTFQLPDIDEYVGFISDAAGPIAMVLRGLSAADREAVKARRRRRSSASPARGAIGSQASRCARWQAESHGVGAQTDATATGRPSSCCAERGARPSRADRAHWRRMPPIVQPLVSGRDRPRSVGAAGAGRPLVQGGRPARPYGENSRSPARPAPRSLAIEETMTRSKPHSPPRSLRPSRGRRLGGAGEYLEAVASRA